MKSAAAAGKWALVLGILIALSSETLAQPRGRGGRAARAVPVEQVLGFLAFDDDVGLSDDQFLKIWNDLKAVRAKRQTAVQEAGGDQQAVTGKMMELRKEMQEKLNAVLTPKQSELMKAYFKRMQERMQNMQGRQRGDRQGGGGGERRPRGDR